MSKRPARREDPPQAPPRWRRITVPVPPAARLARYAALAGTLSLGHTLARGDGPSDPARLWAVVTLAVAGLLYDVAHTALRRRGR